MAPHVSACMAPRICLESETLIYSTPSSHGNREHLYPSSLPEVAQTAELSAMALLLFHALLLATAAAAMDTATGDGSGGATSPALCRGEGCEPQPLPIYGYPPPAPSLPSAPPTPPSAPGSQTPCAPVAVVCCGGAAGGQYMPQQPTYNGPPTTGYVPYYNASASPPALLVPLAGYGVMVITCFSLLRPAL